MSKYTPTEFIPGVKFYTGHRSPNEGEREVFGYSKAWMHHKGRNRHHFEYWVDYNIETHRNEPVEMPYNYVAEMYCDRLAASKIYNGKKYSVRMTFIHNIIVVHLICPSLKQACLTYFTSETVYQEQYNTVNHRI